MFADKWRIKFTIVLFATLVVLAALWLHERRRDKWIPSSGGSALSVQLADNTHFMQNDPRWGTARMGGPDGGTLGAVGCTVASVAMALTNLGHPLDPGQLNAALTADNGFTRQSWLVWGALPRITKGAIRVDVHPEPSLEKLDACLARGDYPIVKFRIFEVVPHWVTVVGKRDGAYYIRDPAVKAPAPIPLTQRTDAIYSVRCIGKAPTAAPVSAPAPAPAPTPGM